MLQPRHSGQRSGGQACGRQHCDGQRCALGVVVVDDINQYRPTTLRAAARRHVAASAVKPNVSEGNHAEGAATPTRELENLHDPTVTDRYRPGAAEITIFCDGPSDQACRARATVCFWRHVDLFAETLWQRKGFRTIRT